MNINLYWIALAIVTVLSASRLTRIAVIDDFPPVVFFRDWLYNRLEGSGWQAITWCGFCISFWITSLVVGWGCLAHVYGHPPNSVSGNVWWFINGALAASYLATTYITIDGDE